MNSKILVVGGAGYCGSYLVPKLLNTGWEVTVYDTFWYGENLPRHPNLSLIRGDVRDLPLFTSACAGQKFVLHLACISNDSSFELDESLSTSINLSSFEPVVLAAKAAGVSRFVFASSSSVYGISSSLNVTEEHILAPLTLYSKYKAMCEEILLSHTDDDFTGVIFRPATVCGASPRQRLDLSVNILTNFAFNRGRILVFGGHQLRPNLHIQDYADVCMALLSAPQQKVADQIFNVGANNMSIMEIAGTVKRVIEDALPNRLSIPLEVSETDDLRSYHINSEKINRVLGFQPKHIVEDAIRDLLKSFIAGNIPNSFDDDVYYNVRTMKKLAIV